MGVTSRPSHYNVAGTKTTARLYASPNVWTRVNVVHADRGDRNRGRSCSHLAPIACSGELHGSCQRPRVAARAPSDGRALSSVRDHQVDGLLWFCGIARNQGSAVSGGMGRGCCGDRSSRSLILGFLPRWTALLLIAFVVMASATSHRYWEFTEAAARRAQEISFYKDVGIIAGLLFYFVSGPGAWSFAQRKSAEIRQPQSA